jgi:hypothetical protein
MPQPRPSPQSALRNVPQVVVRPAWENTVACSYLPRVRSSAQLFAAATLWEPNSKPGHRLLHCTPLLVPAAESSPSPSLSAQRLHHTESLLLDLSAPSRVSCPLPEKWQRVGQRDVSSPGRGSRCGGSPLRVVSCRKSSALTT